MHEYARIFTDSLRNFTDMEMVCCLFYGGFLVKNVWVASEIEGSDELN